jgi:potassium efflux system protein
MPDTNKRIHTVCWLVLQVFLAPVVSARDGDSANIPPALVTANVLQAKIAETEADLGLDAETKGKLVALYRKALSNLEEVNTHSARADAFEATARTAPEQTQRIGERIEAAKAAAAPEALDVGLDTPYAQIERQLKREQAERAAADARRGELERQRAYQESQPAAIRQRLAAAQEEQEALAAALQAELAGAPDSALMQARRWSLETRYVALSTEIKALEQELVSLPMRLDLLAARRDEESSNNARIEQRIEALRALGRVRREAEAKQAKDAAERMRQLTANQGPELARLAEQNAALTASLADLVEQSDQLDAEQQQTERLAARTKANLERVQTAKAVGIASEGLGQILLEHHAAMPDFEAHARRSRAVKEQIAAVNLSRLRHLEEAERLADPAKADPSRPAAKAAASSRDADAAAPRDMRRDLLEQRRDLLARQLEAEEQHLQQLRKLQASESLLLAAVRAYDVFLREQLFWVPTGTMTRLTDLAKLPEELRLLLARDRWAEFARNLSDQVARSPVFWLALLLSAVLLWKRSAVIAAIKKTAAPLDNLGTDRFRYTLRALILTLVIAAPIPLLLGVIGSLLAATEGTELSRVLGAYLLRVALVLYVLRAMRTICRPGGLALVHFRWTESNVRLLYSEPRWLTWVLVPAIFVVRLAMGLYPREAGGLVARIGLLVAAVALALFFYRLLHPRHGVLREQRQSADSGLVYRAYPLWFPLLVAFPLLLLALVLRGYVYTALILSNAFMVTLGMIAGLIILHSLAVRWLTLARRRLALQAARESRQAAEAAREQEASPARESADLAPSEYAGLNLEEASAHSLELLRIANVFVAALGLYLIWSAVFPALGVLDEVTLWYSTATVDGEERRLPISLADLGLALIYLGAAAVLAKRLPDFLNMILAQRLQVASGSRYTITTLATYTIIAVGLLLALHTIGAQWSQLQWLVAALGVGIGFGLQEIVANFISGLIILFERPVRIGDVVTIGDTDGVVTKIRIRATTIRNWDRKELLVPNKEFITGRLLNWSLSDHITRLMVPVGVAYGTDVDQALTLMRQAAEEHPHVLDDPKPVLSFEGFGDNSLTLVLRAFVGDLDHRLATITDLHKAINRKFQQAGIAIAFPQRDLHLDTREPLRVSLEAPPPERPAGGRSAPPSESP